MSRLSFGFYHNPPVKYDGWDSVPFMSFYHGFAFDFFAYFFSSLHSRKSKHHRDLEEPEELAFGRAAAEIAAAEMGVKINFKSKDEALQLEGKTGLEVYRLVPLSIWEPALYFILASSRFLATSGSLSY